MPEPVSMMAICLAGYSALNAYARGGSAISYEARAAEEAATGLVESVERSQALFGEKAAALSQLRELAVECSEIDWDGAGTLGIDAGALLNVQDVIRALPAGIRMPEFSAEPDGAISLDWIESRTRIFSLSVGAGSRLAFAWLDGSDSGYGVARFDGERIPARVLEGIYGIIGNANTTVWPF